jgi:5'-3' exonuclease
MRYQIICIDALNLLYRVRTSLEEKPTRVSKKGVYKGLVADYILQVNELLKEHLEDGGHVYFLFDYAPTHRGMSKSFRSSSLSSRKTVFKEYKINRKKESKEFYNSLDLIKYYYLSNKPKFRCIQMDHVEADDIMKPVLKNFVKDKDRCLMITNDSDWTRYLKPNVDWLPSLKRRPQTIADFQTDHGYLPTEDAIIFYKSVFGDSADNVPRLITSNDKNKADMLNIIRDENFSLSNVARMACDSKLLKTSPVIAAVADNQIQYKVNVQLVSETPITDTHLEARVCIGRDSQLIPKTIETILELRQNKTEFVFGNIKYNP